MAFTFTEGIETISTVEHSMAQDAAYNSASLVLADALVQYAIDGAAIVAGEVYRARLYRTINGTVRVVHEAYLTPGTATLFPATPVQMPAAGWDATLVKVSGTDRSIGWSDGRQTAEPTAAAIATAVWAFAHETGRTAKGILVRLDALMAGKATGLLGTLATFYRSDGVTKAIEATQDTTLGTRETASTVGGD